MQNTPNPTPQSIAIPQSFEFYLNQYKDWKAQTENWLTDFKVSDEISDKEANDKAVHLRSLMKESKDKRMEVTRQLDELKQVLMQPEKGYDELIAAIQEKRNVWANEKHQKAMALQNVVLQINNKINTVDEWFSNELAKRNFKGLEAALNATPKLKKEDFEAWTLGQDVTTYEDVDKSYRDKMEAIKDKYRPIIEQAKNEQPKPAQEIEQKAKEILQENQMNRAIEQQLVAQTSTPELPKGTRTIRKAQFKSPNIATFTGLIKFYVETCSKNKQTIESKMFEKFLAFAAENGSPQIAGIEYIDEIKTVVKA